MNKISFKNIKLETVEINKELQFMAEFVKAD